MTKSTVAAESTAYSKKSLETSAVYFEQLPGAKTFESSLQVQSDYARTFFTELLEYLKKTGEVYSNFFNEAFKPVDSAVTKVQAYKGKTAARSAERPVPLPRS